MGGYGENLRARLVGYCAATPDGVRRTLMLHQIDVPVICTPEDFQTFIDKTPPKSRAVAIVLHNPVLSSAPLFGDEVMHALVYEKQEQVDKLYLYYQPDQDLDLPRIQAYLRPQGQIYTSDACRIEQIGLAGLCAIEDARQLLCQSGEHVMRISSTEGVQRSPLFFKPALNTFCLRPEFSYHQRTLIEAHVETMLALTESKVYTVR